MRTPPKTSAESLLKALRKRKGNNPKRNLNYLVEASMKWLAALCAASGLWMIAGWPTPIFAEEFDFRGAVLLHCICPSPTQAGNCGLAGRAEWSWYYTIHVRPGLHVDLSDACFAKRSKQDVCCDSPRNGYRGTIS